MTATIGAALVCLCFTACLAFAYKSIKLAIDVVDAAADFIMVTKRILIIPFVYFLLSMTIVIVWFGGYLAVMSMNPIKAY